MINKRGWIALVASPICLAAVLLTSADSSHQASAGGVVDPTCTSSSPCIEYDNNSTGQGLKGFSHQGNGLTGWTGWNSTSSTNSKYGVVGNDQSVSGAFDGGVLGKSVRGTGVSGVSTGGPGVTGISTIGIGVQGIGGGAGAGVEGDGAPSGSAIFARSTGGYGSYLFNSAGLANPAFRVDTYGNTGIFGGAYVAQGFGADGNSIAVEAIVTGTDSNGAGIYSQTDNPESWIFRGYSVYHSAYTFEVADDGTVYAKGYATASAMKTLQKTSTGRSVNTYAPQVSQPTLEDYGEAQLVNGVANVALEPTFADAINRTAGYLVTVTPEGDCRGLYVALRSRAGFIVRELQGGRSSIAFSYRIVAKPFGDSSARLPLASIPRGFTPNSERPPQRPHAAAALTTRREI